MPAPGYTHYVAPEKYAQMGWILGLRGHSDEERCANLFAAVDAMLDAVGIPQSLAEAGIPRDEFEAALPDLAHDAFTDPSMRTNPRIPLVAELVALLQAAYVGRPA
jgi:acetaldehyde dehydrogenase/alcohol dehydrogenase